MITSLPHYLASKLTTINITQDDIKVYGHLRVFQYLRQMYPSLSYRALFDLYTLDKLPQHSAVLDKKTQEELINTYKKALPHYLPLAQATIDHFLNLANIEAQCAVANNEIPVGAVVVFAEQVIATGFNQTLESNSIMQHAEIVALNKAAQVLGTHRLMNCDLYVTLEPCAMCVGAIMHSRIRRLIFAYASLDNGAVLSQYQLLNNYQVNKHTEAIGPIAALSGDADKNNMLQEFLQRKRQYS